MSDDTAILEAKDIAGFIDALNKKYQLNMPVTLPEGSPLVELWQRTPIQVRVGNGEGTAYTARGILSFVPFNFDPRLKAIVVVSVYS